MVKVKEQYSHAEYLRNFIRLDNARRHINLACKVLKRMDFDAIAFTGVSGMLIGPTICLRLGKPMIVVRKGDLDDCHSSNRVEGFQAAKRYVIVDDFVGSGDTVRRIQEAVKEFSPKAKCIGTLEVSHLTKSDDKEVKEHVKRFIAGRTGPDILNTEYI